MIAKPMQQVRLQRIIARTDNTALNLGTAAALFLGSTAMVYYAAIEQSRTIIVCYVAMGVLGWLLANRKGDFSGRIFICIYGFSAFAAVVLALEFVKQHGVPYWAGGSDELAYEEAAIAFAQNSRALDYGGIRGTLVTEWHNSVGYIYLVGLMAIASGWVDGFHTMVPRLFNIVCLALVAVQVYHISRQLKLRESTALAAGLIAGVIPLMVWVSIQTLRDIIMGLLLVTLIHLWLPDRTGRWRYSTFLMIVLSALLVVPMWEMRRPTAFSAMFLMAFAILSNRRSFTIVQTILFTAPLLIASAFFIAQYAGVLTSDLSLQVEGVQEYSEYRLGSDIGGGLSRIVFATNIFPIGWLLRCAYALITPIPVAFASLDQTWLSIGTMIHIVFLPFFWRGCVTSIKSATWGLPLVAFAMLFLGMAIFTFTVRHISQYLPFAIILTAKGFESYNGDRSRPLLITASIAALLGVAYIVIK